MTPTLARADAAESYDAVAAFYDDFTAHHDYELWTGEILRAARSHGLRERRLLDVGCGTGKSFIPFAERGWDVVACDVSAEMLARAAQKAGEGLALHLADVRDLPRFGTFDLVLALDDVMNYVTNEDLIDALRGLRCNAAPDGLVIFDCNTELTYRSFFAGTEACDIPGGVALWRGRVDADRWQAGDDSVCELHAFRRTADGPWERHGGPQRQHHHPPFAVRRALGAAGLTLLGLYGHGFDAQLVEPLDELRHTKALYIARPDSRPSTRGGEA